MPEYAFPSGVQIRDVNVAAWSLGLHISLTILLIGSLIAFVWRCCQRASLWDVPAWIVVLLVALRLTSWAAEYPIQRPEFILYAVVITLISSGGAVTTVCRWVNRSVFTAGFLVVLFAGCLFMGIQGTQPGYRRVQCKNNLHNIGLAMHNYHDTFLQFPFAGLQTTESETVHSWRVSILTFFDASRIDFEYRFDEPWNSEKNTTVQKMRAHLYQCPSHPTEQPFTAYAMLTGPGTFGGDGLTGLSINDITDGTSNTLMIVEACGREIIWTEPRDVEVTDESLGINLPGDKSGHSRGIISSYHPGGAHVLFADGAVRFLSEKTEPTVLKALTTIDGGENLPADW